MVGGGGWWATLFLRLSTELSIDLSTDSVDISVKERGNAVEEIAGFGHVVLNGLSAAFALAAAYFARHVNKAVDEHNKRHEELAESLAKALVAARALAELRRAPKKDVAESALVPDPDDQPEVEPEEAAASVAEVLESDDQPRRVRRRPKAPQNASDWKNTLRIAAFRERRGY